MTVLAAVEAMLEGGLPVIAAPNAGLPRRVDERMVYVSTPEYFGVYARRMYKLGIRIVGGCCGTTPEHIKRIAAAARMATAADHDDARVAAEPSSVSGGEAAWMLAGVAGPHAVAPVLRAQKSKLAAKLGTRFVVSVEVNPPVGLDPARAVAAAKSLKAGGVDVVTSLTARAPRRG